MADVPEGAKTALQSVMGSLMAHSTAERRAAEPYQMLFGSFKDGGVAKAVFEAERQMKTVAMNLAQVLRDGTGAKIDNELFAVLLGLPLAMHLVRTDVEGDGSSCAADKTRLVLKTYFYKSMGLDIEAVPFEPRQHDNVQTTPNAGA